MPTFIQLEGFGTSDTRRLEALLARHLGAPVNTAAVEQDIATISGLDRYQSVTWLLTRDPARGVGLRVRGTVKAYGPPFMMIGGYIENATSSDFRIAATARYLSFDPLGSGSELRIDGTIGSDPSAAIELYRPIGPTPLFVAPYAGVLTKTFDLVTQNVILARYRQNLPRAGLNVGVDIGARSDVRVGAYLQHTSASIEGNPGFPEIEGKETGGEVVWRVDTQDSAVVPAAGMRSHIPMARVQRAPC
jgi:NTE family protein